jgi:HSP20 family protein
VRELEGIIADKERATRALRDKVAQSLLGFNEKDLTVTLQRNVLGLTVRRTLERPEGFRPHRQERSSFERTWTLPLPARVDPEKVKATLADGELTVTLAKAIEDQPRTVAVQVA